MAILLAWIRHHSEVLNQDISTIFTGRKEVVAKVMFLLVCVIMFTGGSASVHAGISPLEGGTPPKQTPGK